MNCCSDFRKGTAVIFFNEYHRMKRCHKYRGNKQCVILYLQRIILDQLMISYLHLFTLKACFSHIHRHIKRIFVVYMKLLYPHCRLYLKIISVNKLLLKHIFRKAANSVSAHRRKRTVAVIDFHR